MIVAAVLAMALSGHPPRVQIVRRHLVAAGWSIRVYRDTFTGAVTCSLATKTMRFHRDLVIFRLARAADTTDSYFRIDGSPARRVEEAFAQVQARGFFPRRGWIDDPAGSDVALPAAWLQGAKRIDIRSSSAARPRRFDVSRFAEALAAARAAGCSDRAL